MSHRWLRRQRVMRSCKQGLWCGCFSPHQILLTLRRTIRREIKVERRFNSLLVNQNGGPWSSLLYACKMTFFTLIYCRVSFPADSIPSLLSTTLGFWSWPCSGGSSPTWRSSSNWSTTILLLVDLWLADKGSWICWRPPSGPRYM